MRIKWPNILIVALVAAALWLAASHGHRLIDWWRRAGEAPAGPPSLRDLVLLATLVVGALAARRLLDLRGSGR